MATNIQEEGPRNHGSIPHKDKFLSLYKTFERALWSSQPPTQSVPAAEKRPVKELYMYLYASNKPSWRAQGQVYFLNSNTATNGPKYCHAVIGFSSIDSRL
jgi:hypothetical protein